MWILILFFITVIIVKMMYATYELGKEVSLRGGMRIKYSYLIDLLLSGDRRSKIYSQSKRALTLGLVVTGGYTKFEIIQGFDVLIIKWESKSNIFGKMNIKWQFKESLYQGEMYNIICNDIAKKTEFIP